MSDKRPARGLFRLFYSATDRLVWVAYVALAFIIVLVFLDVIGRYFFRHPIRGSYELVVVAMTVLGGFAMMYTGVKWGHVSIDLITSRFPKGLQNVLQRVTSFAGCVVWMITAGQVVKCGLDRVSSTTDILHIPLLPFTYVLGAATFLFGMVLLVQAIEEVHESKGEIEE